MDNLLQLIDQPTHPILHQVGWVRLAKEISSHAHFSVNRERLERAPQYKDQLIIENEYKLLSIYSVAVELGEFQKYAQEQKKLVSDIIFTDLIKFLNKKEIHSLVS